MKVPRDHVAILFTAKAEQPAPMMKSITLRKLKAINVDLFKDDNKYYATLAISQHSSYVETLVKAHTNELSSLIDKPAPLRTKSIVLRSSCKWYT